MSLHCLIHSLYPGTVGISADVVKRGLQLVEAVAVAEVVGGEDVAAGVGAEVQEVGGRVGGVILAEAAEVAVGAEDGAGVGDVEGDGELGEDNVIECDIVKDDDFLHFRVNGYGTESENLDDPDEDYEKRKEADGEIERRLKEGETYKTIQRELRVSPSDISRVSRRLKNTE